MSARIRVVAVAIVAAGAVASALPAVASTSDQVDVSAVAEHVPGRVLVQYRAGASHASQAAAEHAAGASRVAHVAGVGVEVLAVPVGQELTARENLRHSGAVATAELDGVAHASDTVPNDYWYPRQWGPAKVNAPVAWDRTTGSSAVTVAV